MNELELKYGCNPNQKPARIFMRDGGDLPVRVLNGKPLPSFEGEPEQVELMDDIDALTDTIWTSLNEANKISLFVRFVNLKTGEAQTRIINKHQ